MTDDASIESIPGSTRSQPWSHTGTRRWLIVAVVFALHAVLRYGVIDTPPYWDSVQGPFVEANWLADNNFNYKKLLFEEKDFPSGGPAVYVWSIMPTIYAVTSIAFGGPAAQFVFLHLLTFLLAGLIVMAIHEMLYLELGVRSWLALLVGTLAVLQPTMGGQIDAINMEIPLTTVVVFTTWNLVRGRWITAGLLGLLGVFIKESGVLICLVSLVIGGVNWYSQPMSAARRIGLTVLYLLPLGVLYGMQRLFVAAGHVVSTDAKPVTDLGLGLTHIREAVWPHIPDLYTLMPLATLAIPLVAWRVWRRRPDAMVGGRQMLSALATSPAARLYLATAAITAGWLLMHLLRGAILIRYVVWYVPLFILFIFLTIRYLGASRRAQGAVVGLYLAYALVNQFGVLLPTLEARYGRTGDLRERSREYIEDLKLMVAMTTWLDQNAGDRPVLLQAPLDRAVTDPRLGYSSRPLNVFSLSYPVESPRVPFFLSLTPEGYHQAYIGFFPSIYYHPNPQLYSPGSDQITLARFAGPPAPVFVYRVKPSAETLADPPPLLQYYYIRANE